MKPLAYFAHTQAWRFNSYKPLSEPPLVDGNHILGVDVRHFIAPQIRV
jgi:hypothetical protein